jgi:predicted nucleic acid-binding protein
MGTLAPFDINIFEDVTRARQGWESSLNALASVETGDVDGYISAWTVTVIYYFRRRLGASEQEARERAKALTADGCFRILALDAEIIDLALADDRFPGFEDAIQFHTAERNGVNTIVTRNVKHFSKVKGEIAVLTPEEFLAKELS